jgi:hypothetical protein
MDKKVYTVSPFTWIISIPFFLLAAFFVVFAIVVIPQILGEGDFFDELFIFLAIGGLLIFVIYATLVVAAIPTTRLELSEEGLIFYGTGYRIYTPWENIAGVGWMPLSRAFPSYIQLKKPATVSGLSFVEGILSQQSVVEKRSWWLPAWEVKTFVQYRSSIRISGIIFRKKDKQDSGINQHMQYYLAHLIEKHETE